MEWIDTGLILGVRKHGETSAIIETMTEHHGRHLGLVRGGRSSRFRALLQAGNSVQLTWRARLEEHLGTFQVEPNQLRAASLMEQPLGMYGLQSLAGHLRLLPERDPHEGLYGAGLVLLDHLDEPQKAARLLIRFELAMLEELGFGLDLLTCAATGSTSQLIWVSPKSGRAVSREAGEPYKDRLLALPSFLRDNVVAQKHEDTPSSTIAAVTQGFELTKHFYQTNVYGPRGIHPPDERAGFVRKVLRMLERGEP